MANYALQGQKWGEPNFGTSGGRVTWAVDTSVPASFVPVLASAFAAWSAVADITFEQVTSFSVSVIDITYGTIDGRGGTIGEATYYYRGTTLTEAQIEFDSAEGWEARSGGVFSRGGVDLYVLALHEIGHAIGLDHYNAVPAAMNSILTASITGLTPSDIEGITAVYGRAVPMSSIDALVDDRFYLVSYPDVSAARQDPDEHYARVGWKEGRDPNAYFSTAGYLSANPDVKKAAIDPLQHYNGSGFREGRDPSALFDNEAYLRANPDVARAGVNPLAHYLASGQKEGRATFVASGTPADILDNGFDREFYLLANPDVGRAGLDPLQHFVQFGAREGRDPNAYFDTDAYLNTYADVRAAGMNPLDHYHRFGFKEGRDPSAQFDTSRYLDANPDVRTAGLDPLYHFLEFGRAEGRVAFNDGTLLS